jgi:hypothetical protein
MKNRLPQQMLLWPAIIFSMAIIGIAYAIEGLDIVMPFKEYNTVNGIKITCDYGCGYHKTGSKDEYALDFDLSMANSDEIVAVADGVAVEIKNTDDNQDYGSYIKLKHTASDGKIYYSFYAHLRVNSFTGLKLGSEVKQNQVIALAGNTGNVTPPITPGNLNAGDHLHFVMYDSEGNGVKPEPMYGDKKYENFTIGMSVKSGDYLNQIQKVAPTSQIVTYRATDTLFTPSGKHYFKAPQTVTQLADEYKSGATFGPSNNYPTLDSNVLIEFIDTSMVGPVPTQETIEYNPLPAKQTASELLARDIAASGLSESDIIEGLAKLKVIEQTLIASGKSFNETLQSIIGDEGLSFLKRFAGSLGTDITYSHVLEAIDSVRDSINIPTALTKALEQNATESDAYKQTVNREAQTVIQKLQSAITSSGGVAATIGIALLLVLIGYFQKPKKDAEENLKNIMSSSMASATISKYWNLVALSTQNWLKDFGTANNAYGTVRDSIAEHKKQIQTEYDFLLEKGKEQLSLSESDDKQFAKLHNSLILIERIEKNIIPAKQGDGGYESAEAVAVGFTAKLQGMFQSIVGFFGSKVPVLYPRVLGTSGGSSPTSKGETNTDAPSTTTNAQAGSSAISMPQVATLNNESTTSTINSVADVINHWAKQYIVVGTDGLNGFIAADGKVYTDLNKAWDVTREFIASNKPAIPFSTSSISSAEASRIKKAYENGNLSVNLNHLPERNPAKGWKGTLQPLPASYTSVSPLLANEGGVSSATQGGGISYDFWQKALNSFGAYGMTPISYSEHYGMYQFAVNENYPEGLNSTELRIAAENKVNEMIQAADPYDIIHPKWESYNIFSAEKANGIRFGQNNLDVSGIDLAIQMNLIDKLKSKPVVTQVYRLSDKVIINNTTNNNNAGIRVIKLPDLPEDIKALGEKELQRIAMGLSMGSNGNGSHSRFHHRVRGDPRSCETRRRNKKRSGKGGNAETIGKYDSNGTAKLQNRGSK